VRILSVRVKNVRMHEDQTVEFDRERTVVAGPNESGKSTLVDAIERVLCYPHRSSADNLDGFRPKAGGGTPEVCLRFERHGRTYEILKIFKGPQSVARLTDQDGVAWTGDEAEERLRALLGFGASPLRNAFRGWSHLWARQGKAGDDPTDVAVLGAAAKDLDARLKSMAGTTLTESARDTATFDRIASEHDATFTPTGVVRTASRLGVARTELAAAREAATHADARLSELEAAADTVVREDALIQESRTTLADAESQLGEIRKTLADIELHEQTLARQGESARAATTALAELERAAAEVEELTASITARSQTLAPREHEIDRLSGHEARLQASVAECLTAIENAHATQRMVAVTEDLLKAVAKAFELGADRVNLEATLEAHEAAIAAIDGRLHDLPEVDKAAVEGLEDLDRQREVGLGKLAASATRIEVLRAGAAVVVDGQVLAAGEAATLTDPAEVTIGDGTTLRVRPGSGESMLELRADVAQVRQDLATRLDELGLKDVASARTTLDRRLAEEARRERLREKIADLDGDGVQGRLREVIAEVQKIEAEIGRKQPEGFDRPADAAACAAAVHGLAERRSQADEAVRTARADFDRATGEYKQTRLAREDLEKALSTERQELQGLRVQQAALETVHGTDRPERLRLLAADKEAKQDAVAATERMLASLGPDKVRDDKERYERTVKVTTDLIHDANLRRARAEVELHRSGTMDPHAAKAAADARREIALRRHAEIDQRAQAVRRLRDLFEKQRQSVAEVVVAPLRAKVAEYLDALFGTGTRVAITKCGETFEDLELTRQSFGGLAFEFDQLSGGTREQVAAACRLAMAEVLAGGDGGGGETVAACLPMVFDDAFVNSDPERIREVQRVLDLGARRGLQIIVLSCHPQEYGLFGARRVDLPPPRRSAAVTPAAPAANPPTDNAER
jgi:energy-coupling factor transporter ATP-binding protein EcfA2